MSIQFTNLIKVLVVSAASSVLAVQTVNSGVASASNNRNFPQNGTSVLSDKLTVSSSSEISREKHPNQFLIAESIPDVIDRTMFFNTETTLENWTMRRQLNLLFGWYNFEGSYPENEIFRDAELVNIVHYDLRRQQGQSDPPIRTRDLANPFATSIVERPCYIRPTRILCTSPSETDGRFTNGK